MKTRVMGEKAKGRNLGTSLDNPRMDFCQLARGMGVHGEKVERPQDLKDVLKSAFDSDRPELVEVYMESI